MENEEVYTILSGNGELYLDATGKVVRHQKSPVESQPIESFDLDEFKYVWGTEDIPNIISIRHIRGILKEDGKELVSKDYQEARRLRPGREKFEKHNVSPYPRHVQRMSSKTRAGRKAKAKAKQAHAGLSSEE